MSDAILKQRDADETKNGICEFDSIDADALAKCIEDSYEYIKNNTNHPGVPDWVVMTATTTSKIVGDAVKKLQSTAYSGQLFGLNNSSSLLDVGDAWKASALESMPINKISSFLSGSFAGVLVGVATAVYTNQDNQQKMIDDLEKVVPSVLIGYGLTELLVAGAATTVGAGCVVLAPEAAVAIGVILAAYTTNFIIKTVTESDWFNDLFGEADKVLTMNCEIS
jgi:hypothetical protein